MELRVRVDDAAVRRALTIAPRAAQRHIGLALDRAGQEVAREEKRVAPQAHSNLVNAIISQREALLVRRVSAGVQHAVYVEEGTGPGGRPNLYTLMQWIRVKRITPRQAGMSVRDLAFVIGRSIARKGIRAQPFAAPTAEKMQSRVMQLVAEGARNGLREAGFA